MSNPNRKWAIKPCIRTPDLSFKNDVLLITSLHFNQTLWSFADPSDSCEVTCPGLFAFQESSLSRVSGSLFPILIFSYFKLAYLKYVTKMRNLKSESGEEEVAANQADKTRQNY